MYMINPGNVDENINSHEAFKEEKRMEKKQGFLKKFLTVMIAVFSLTLLSPEVATQLGTMQTVQAAVKLSSKSLTIVKGQKKTLKLKGTKKKAKWSSSKKSVATVSSKGVVVGKKKGTTVITAKVGSKKYTCKVTVETPKLNKKSVTLSVGKSSTLKVTGTKQKVKWLSSNTAIAAVTRNGKVVAKSAGTAEVIANVGGAKFVCKVNVKGSQKPATKPTEAPKPEIKYGKVTGNITYHYNQYRGYVADTGAKVYLIPKNGSASKAPDLTDMDFAYMFNINKINANNIYCAKVDGKGEYTINHIPEGEYLAVIVSKNSKSGDWFEANDKDKYYDMIANGWRNYLNESTSLALAKSISFYRYGLRSISVYGNDTTTLSYEFPYTYI